MGTTEESDYSGRADDEVDGFSKYGGTTFVAKPLAKLMMRCRVLKGEKGPQRENGY